MPNLSSPASPSPAHRRHHSITSRKENAHEHEQFRAPSFEWTIFLSVWLKRAPDCAQKQHLCLGLLWLALTLLLQLSAASTPQRKHWLLFYVKHLTVVRSGIVFYIVAVVARRRVIVNTNEDCCNPSGGIWNMDLQISRWWNVSVTNE